ncbi:MAG: hypothetical protein IT569_07485, partial [Leptospiraceae bacterium]|nr:hypothetical protein [Leptospiraceae bacterium]
MEAEDIKKKLISNSIINPEDILSFIPVEASFSRKDYKDRERFLIEINGVKKLVLRIATNLSDLIEKHKLISSQFPKLIPDLAIHYRDNGRDFMFEEFIQGETL